MFLRSADLPTRGDLLKKRGVAFMNRTESFNSFKLAENRATSSPWVGDHRYTSISCASKLKWVYSDLNLKNLELFPGFPGIPRNHGTAGSYSKSAEYRAASSLLVGGYRYTGIKLALKPHMGLERFEVDKSRAFSWISCKFRKSRKS